MYQKNYDELKKVVEEKAIIIPVREHRKPDGTMNIERNLKRWNEVLSRFEVTPLWPKGKTPNYDDRDPNQPEPSIVFIPAQGEKKSDGTIIVSHGGGFEIRTGCEGIHVAEWFSRNGFNTAILTYRIKPYSREDALDDILRAIRLLRHRKEEFGISEKVVCMGFSAGGMLSGNAATLYDYGDPESEDPIERESSRPDGAVLGYGAFAFSGLPGGFFADPFSKEIRNPFFKDRDDLYRFSPEVNFNRQTPPFFIWQTNSDDPRHSFTTGAALTAAGVPFEMHLFPEGVHGLAMADGNNDLEMDVPSVAQWAPLCANWLTRVI